MFFNLSRNGLASLGVTTATRGSRYIKVSSFLKNRTSAILSNSNSFTTSSVVNSKEVAHRLVLVRHGESIWNQENRFTGWYDVALSEKGIGEAKEGGKLLREGGYGFDVAFTSMQKRAIKTCLLALEEMNLLWIPVIKSWRLNERHYGALTGLDKKETVEKHGSEQVNIWRRSYDIPPPALEKSSEHYPGNDRRYDDLSEEDKPVTESLATTLVRVMPYWNDVIKPTVASGKRVLIAAHGNSLRALVKEIDGISEDEIAELNIPTGVPLVYEFDKDMNPIPSPKAIQAISGYYVGDQGAIKARIEGVKNQTK